jgi:Bacteriocin-protection, YdeI or OmpD-Associated/Domain of unknown function (DUF1905)
VRFTTTLAQGESKNVVGIVIPPEIITALGGGKRPPVKVTINGYTYQSTVAVMGGDFMVGVAAEHRQTAGVSGGETLEVQIELDAAPRTVELPADLAAALTEAGAMAAFEALAPSYRKEHVRNVSDAKTDDTRRRRIESVTQKVLATRK